LPEDQAPASRNLLFGGSCWSGRLHGKYINEQQGANDECFDFDTAKQKCEEATDCHGIATQSNVCSGKYRVTHGSTATLVAFRNWASFNLWAYTLDRSCLSPSAAHSGSSNQKLWWKCSRMGNGPLDIPSWEEAGACNTDTFKKTQTFTPTDSNFNTFNDYLKTMINAKLTTKWGGLGRSANAFYGPAGEDIASCCKLLLDWGLSLTKPTTAGSSTTVALSNSAGTGPYEIRGTNTCAATKACRGITARKCANRLTQKSYCKKWQTQFSGFLGAALSFEVAQVAVEMEHTKKGHACNSWDACT